MLRYFAVLLSISLTTSFTTVPGCSHRIPTLLRETAEETEAVNEAIERSDVDKFLELKYPAFYALIGKNEAIGKVLKSDVVTVFVPNAQAFENLGEKKLAQLGDPRNLEIVEKIGAYHIVQDESVPATRLFQEDWTVPKTDAGNPELSFRGIKTMGGEVAVGRTKSGGFLGLFAEEDGGVVIGPEGRITKSYSVGDSFVHEVDALVNPQILWRYCDQLRIPGF